ncbi:serine/threonine-protein kinase [Hyalangium minutum]|nr:serine/threonine-protein kinase [Hyalangium minutum]
MAELFLAFTSGPGGFRKYVALKQILPDVKTEEFVKMFLDEARITAAFSHPNIGQVFDLGLEDDELYLAMEFLPGQNLEQVMMAASYVRPLPIGFAARVARDVCLGLHYAHNFTAPSGRKVAVVHRDMAPRNVMITYDGVVKVIDFGIAKAKGRIARTRVGMVKGTSGYMSPEQVRGQDLDGRSDLFTAGVLLHEMLCGQRLFDTTNEDAMMRQIANAEIAPPRANNPDVPESLDAVVMKALAKDPAKRFATGREMAKALEVAVGPVMFDEESVAELMQALFADKRLKTLSLLDYASHDDERVSKVVAALRDEETLDGAVSADELDDMHLTSPMMSMPVQKPVPPPEPVRPPPSRASSPSGRVNPPKARPFPSAAPKKNTEPPSRKIPVAKPFAEDAPTQIGPVPGLAAAGADDAPDKTTIDAPSSAREPRRPAKMGVFTLGPTESQAAASAPETKPTEDDSETSELSSVSRVSRAWTGLRPPARRGLWIVLGIVILGLAVLFMPESLKSKIGSLFSSSSSAPTKPTGSAEPSSEAYEPPPPSEDAPPEEPTQKAAPSPNPAGEAPRPPRPRPPKAVPQPSEAPAKSESPANPEEQAPKPAEEAVQEVAPEPTEPTEPSQGPAEVDPSIRPLEDSPPSTDGEEQ